MIKDVTNAERQRRYIKRLKHKASISWAALEHFDQRLRAVEDFIRKANRVLASMEYLREQTNNSASRGAAQQADDAAGANRQRAKRAGPQTKKDAQRKAKGAAAARRARKNRV